MQDQIIYLGYPMERSQVTWNTISQMHIFFPVHIVDEYFDDIVNFFSTRFSPKEFNIVQKKNLVVRFADYQLIAGQLYKLG
jgi:hypothetical protein